MRNFFFIVFFMLITVSCTSSTSQSNSSNSCSISIPTKKTYEPNFVQVQKHREQNNLLQENIANVLKKIKNKKELSDKDYNIITTFLLKNDNEALSEEVGYCLFRFLKENKSANNAYSSFLKDKDYKEIALEELIKIMCIDLGDEEYTYNRLIEKFSIFRGSQIAKRAFDECMRNQVQ